MGYEEMDGDKKSRSGKLLLSLVEEMTPAEMALVCGVTPEAFR